MPVQKKGNSAVQGVQNDSRSVVPNTNLSGNVGVYLLHEVNRTGWRVIFVPFNKRSHVWGSRKTLPFYVSTPAEDFPLLPYFSNNLHKNTGLIFQATWVKRCPSEEDTCDLDKETIKKCDNLTDTQKEKLAYFFAHVFDMDRDDIIALQDFEGFTEVGTSMCSRRLKFTLKTLNDVVAESYGFQDALDDIQIACQGSDESGSKQSAGAVLAWLDDPKPDRIGRLLAEEPKLSGEIIQENNGFSTFVHGDNRIMDAATMFMLNRLRHFAEWSSNCGEYLILQQVQQGLIETFIYPLKQDADSSEGENQGPKELDRLFLGLEEWLVMWGDILGTKKNFYDLPLWLQFLPKVLFTAINKSGTGKITKEELGSFYSSVMGYPAQKLNDLLNVAYTAMTAGGDFKLTYDCYRLCFANFLFGRHPNGPGQYIFGAAQKAPPPLFPIDYSAMNSSQEDIEPYNGSLKSNRSSIIV